jgi:transcriptional regulator with XRE-family HTH domain
VLYTMQLELYLIQLNFIFDYTILYPMNTPLTNQQIGKTVKLIRELRNYSQNWVAKQAGYKDKTTYSRFESGKIKHLDFERLQCICHALNCTTVQIILFASIEAFRYNIGNWNDFIASLLETSDEERSEMLVLLKQIFPNKYDEILKELEAYS